MTQGCFKMAPQDQTFISRTSCFGSILHRRLEGRSPIYFIVWGASDNTATKLPKSFSAEMPQPEETDDSLTDVARQEREYVRRRLVEQLRREPTEEEINEWLRQQTEGY